MTQSRSAEIRQATRSLITTTLAADLASAHQQAEQLAADPNTARAAIVALAEAAAVILAGAAAAAKTTEEAVWQILAAELAACDNGPPPR